MADLDLAALRKVVTDLNPYGVSDAELDAAVKRFLETFRPSVVLSLLDRIEELEGQLGKLRAEHLGGLADEDMGEAIPESEWHNREPVR